MSSSCPELRPEGATEESITVSWSSPSDPDGDWVVEAHGMETESWDSCLSARVAASERRATLDGLQPTATYELRLRVAGPDGSLSAPGPVLTMNTEVANCGPKCTVM